MKGDGQYDRCRFTRRASAGEPLGGLVLQQDDDLIDAVRRRVTAVDNIRLLLVGRCRGENNEIAMENVRQSEENRPFQLIPVVVRLDQPLAIATDVHVHGFVRRREPNVLLVEIEIGLDLLIGGLANLIG